jgi:homeobox-leucine zipper protein
VGGGGIGGDLQLGDATEISSENTGSARTQSGRGGSGEEGGHGNDGGDHKKRKRYHRHRSGSWKRKYFLF